MLMRTLTAITMAFALYALPAFANPPTAPSQGRVVTPAAHAVLPPRQRIAPENAMLTDRLEHLLPSLMAETNIDMWLVLNREYAEDPVYFSLVPQPSFAARRTTMLVFHLRENGQLDRLTVNRYPLGPPYESAWQGGDLDAQWQALGALIEARNPERIGINVSADWPEADGLTHGLHQKLLAVLPAGFEARLVPAESLVVRWLETRSAQELAVYPHIVSIARGVLAEGFSSAVITPGVTTTDDVAWFLRERFEGLGLPIWFMPYVNIQRAGMDCQADNPFCGMSGVIEPGDVLHTDVGICYLKLCTDTQEMAYVMRLGEDEVPAGLQHALAEGNRWQDLLTDEFVTGRSGNAILAAAQARMAAESWPDFNVYTHPIGFFGHAPGPTIGMWDVPGAVAGAGDWPLYPNTAYAIEGSIKVAVDEWEGQLVHIKLEQGAVFDGDQVLYLGGRQTEWHVIR